MDKRIVLALAGAGKTYYITHDFEEDERVYMISFTNRNVENIHRAVRNRFAGKVPKNVIITTFDAFVYNQLLKPVEDLLRPQKIILNGVEVIKAPITDSRKPNYKNINTEAHYVTREKRIYVNRMSKLIMKQSDGIKKLLLDRLSKYCDAIYFDEFQDYNGYDFKLMEWIINKFVGRVVAVGDIYQSLVRPIRRDGNSIDKSPFSSIFTPNDLMEQTKLSSAVEIITNQLQRSRRVNQDVATFIENTIGVSISGHCNEGAVIYLTSIEAIDSVMRNREIVKLIWNKTVSCNEMENYVNWSYSKGDTYKDVCIVLTKSTDDVNKWKNLDNRVRNTLYVALTRAMRYVYIVHVKNFNEWKALNS